MSTPPTVTGIICTIGGRPEMLRDAVRAIAAQDINADLEILVVFDHVAIDELTNVDLPENVSLRTLVNDGPRGLAGGRNSGVRHARGQFVAFCDDDDAWEPAKLRLQLAALDHRPDAVAVAGGIAIVTDSGTVRRNPPAQASFEDFLRSRITEIHPSAVLYRTADLRPGGMIGPVDEDLPHGYGEDYDLLLRATRNGPVVSVPETVLTVRWDRPSYFAGKWDSLAEGLTYILQKFPEFETCPPGLARITGQVAFAHAARGRRRSAIDWARATLRRNPLQLRGWAALVVGLTPVPADTLLNVVQSTGRGL